MIELRNVTKSYNGERVLKGIDLTVADGEFLSVMGESGSGKSTLLNVMGGFLQPDGGSVLWNGADITAFDGRARSEMRCKGMGFVFQAFRLISTLTAEENVLLPAALASCDVREVTARLKQLFSLLGLDGAGKKYPDELSGGQQQRVAIARALICAAPVVILDEPTGALDSAMQKNVMQLLRRINADGVTVIQVTHSLAMAEYGSRIVRIRDGNICG